MMSPLMSTARARTAEDESAPKQPSSADALHSAALPAPKRHLYIPALDGIRGIAILLVLVFHFTVVDKDAKSFRGLGLHLLNAGWVGVDLFFALSGFLITSILFEAKNTRGYFRNFYM